MSSPYQNQTVVVHNNVNVNNNNVNEDRTVVKTQHKKKKKNIRYTGTTLLFLTIVVAVAVTVMISARKVPPTLFGSVTNTNVRTSTSTAIMSSEDDEDDDETWYDADEEKEAGQHDDSDTDTGNTGDRFDPHEYPPVQYTPKKEATGGYGNTVTVTKKNTKKKCPACYFPTSTLVGNVCQQLCHDTQQEQTQAVRKGRGWNFLGTNKVQDNWCAGTYLSTNEVQVGKDNFRMACTFKTGSDTGGSIFDKS
mmetsp:Transcript_14359/g.16140  ORF Transcript_14359/g.16140 Transcript_14359/m.16140 type:complete len:250 (-) Transcript_14359:159-908(-)